MIMLRPFSSYFFLVGIICFYLPKPTMAQFFNYPGGIVELNIDKEGPELPDIKYGLKDVTILDRGIKWKALIGIGLETLPGDYLLYIKYANDEMPAFHQKFTVAQKQPLFVDKQIAENDLGSRVYSSLSDIDFSNTVEPELPLNYPTTGEWTDQFGALEIAENGENLISRNYVSLTTTRLSTVLAPQNGIVSRVIADDPGRNSSRNISIGNTDNGGLTSHTIIIDHGRGLHSILSGVMDITIEPGNGVLAGAVLGKIYTADSSNSQPHTLYWQTILNGAYVNPVILTQLR